jgi:hypothetical protein
MARLWLYCVLEVRPMPERARPTAEAAIEELVERARRRWGDAPAEAIRALGPAVPNGLALLAAADLGDADEPDFLRAGGVA